MYNTIEEKVQGNSNPRLPRFLRERRVQSAGISYPVGTPRNDLAEIWRLLGRETVLVPYYRGSKVAMRKRWNKTTVEETRYPDYVRDLETNNVGILLGPSSGNLVVVDIDDELLRSAFETANRDICEITLSSKGARGPNYWFRIKGVYPTEELIILNAQGDHVGEFRGGNCGSIIAGRHPKHCDYSINGVAPLEIPYNEIVWPDGYSLEPKRKKRSERGTPGDTSADRSGSYEPGRIGLVPASVGTGGIYDDKLKAELRARLPEYLTAIGVRLEPYGDRLKGLCPNHDDHNPSFDVFGENHDRCGCFPCDFNGDVFATSQWLGRSNSFPEAVRDVAVVLGVTLPDVRVPTFAGGAEFTEFEVLPPEEQETRDVPFPVHCIPGVAGEMAREIARVTTSQNLPLAAASVLGVLSASLGAGLEISTGGERRTRGNLYILAIADSGTGKGEAFDLAAAPLQEFESLVTGDFEMAEEPRLMAELQVTESRAKELGKRALREDDPVKIERLMKDQQTAAIKIKEIQQKLGAKPQLIVADATKEALAIRLAGQAGEALASMSSEARGVFSIIKGRYGKEGGDEDFYCKCYSGDSISVDRVGRPRVGLRRPCLSILWMVQPDAARDAFSNVAFTESGLMPRFLAFNAKAEPLVRDRYPDPIPREIKGGWAKLVSSLTEGYRMTGLTPRTVAVAGGVARVMLDYENENIRMRQRSGEMNDVASYVARWTENAWRMAVVLHAAKHGAEAHTKELDEDTATKAVEISRWFGMMQSEVLNAGRIKKMRDRLVKVLEILADRKGEISLRELRRSHSIEKEEIVSLGKWFPGKFKIVTRDTGGRPSEVLTNRPEDLKVTEPHR